MALATARPAPAGDRARAGNRPQHSGSPFLGLIDAVMVDSPTEFQFPGAIAHDDAAAVWLWMRRDLAPDLIDTAAIADPRAAEALEAIMPDLLARARKSLADAAANPEIRRRIMAQLGGEPFWDRLANVLDALRCRGLLDKAQSFGRATNSMTDDASVVLALQAMPFNDPPVAALLMQAAVGQVANPTRLITAAIRLAGADDDIALNRAGFGPLVDAILAHAQDQVPKLSQMGAYGDMDLVCRSVDRFHRLLRSINGYVELGRSNRWTMISAALIKAVSERIEPKLRDVVPDINKALRRRDGSDRLDGDQLLSALNGMYLLATVRDCRDSLALNALFDTVWTQSGQALEIHIERIRQAVRQNPSDTIATARLDSALKMSEVRFGQEYADVIRRATDGIASRS